MKQDNLFHSGSVQEDFTFNEQVAEVFDSDIRCFCSHPMSSEEQRRTEWMTSESYEDFIDKEHSGFTIEKYPAPWRVFFKAKKG